MSKILLINNVTKNDFQMLNEVVAILEDSQTPTQKEIEKFTIIEFLGETGDQTRAKLNNAMPEKKTMWKEQFSSIWKILDKDPKFKIKFENDRFVSVVNMKQENLKIVNEEHMLPKVISSEKLRLKNG